MILEIFLESESEGTEVPTRFCPIVGKSNGSNYDARPKVPDDGQLMRDDDL